MEKIIVVRPADDLTAVAAQRAVDAARASTQASSDALDAKIASELAQAAAESAADTAAIDAAAAAAPAAATAAAAAANAQIQPKVDEAIGAATSAGVDAGRAEAAADRIDLGALDDAVEASGGNAAATAADRVATGQDRGAAETAAANAAADANAQIAPNVAASAINAGRSEAARDQAEAFASASATAAKYYDTIALGRAAVADGASFGVVAGGTDGLVRPTLYRRDSSSTQTELVDTALGSEIDGVGLSLATLTGYLNTSGTLVSDANWRSSDFLPVALLDVLRVSLVGATAACSIAFYRANRTFISGVSAATNLGRVTTWPSVPSGAEYVRITRHNASKQALVLRPATKGAASAVDLDRLRASGLSLFTVPGFINLSGQIASGTFTSTELIPVDAIRVASLRLSGHTAACSVAWYNAAGGFISGTSVAANGDAVMAMPSRPAGAAFVRFCHQTTATWQEELVLEAEAARAMPALARGVMPTDITALANRSGYLVATTGAPSAADANWLHSDFIPCQPGEKIAISTWGNTNVGHVCFYTAGPAFLSAVPATANSVLFATEVTVPSGAASYRFCVGNPAGSSVPDTAIPRVVTERSLNALAIPSAPVPRFHLQPFSPARKVVLTPPQKGLLYGDSISSTDYPWYKAAMEDLTGIDWYNGGFSGNTAAQLAADDRLDRIWTYGGDIVVFMPGGNDSGAPGTVGTFGAIFGEPLVTETDLEEDYTGTTFIQAVSHVVRRIRAQYDDIRTRADLDGDETEADKNAKIAAVLKPVLILATTLPMNRAGAYDITENQQRKRNAIVEVSQRYKVGCVDLYNLVGWDRSQEPYPESPTNKTVNKGCWTMDGLHPNQFGYRQIAEIVCGQIGI